MEELTTILAECDISESRPRVEAARDSTEVELFATDSSYEGKEILSKVEKIMDGVCDKLHNQVIPKLSTFLMRKIKALKTEKRELVGVFGRTGAGKSSLINAILKEKDLLPYGKISACTSTVIKVEANLNSTMYEADIEFINKEDWKDELWSKLQLCKENDEPDDDQSDFENKLSALYQEEWRQKSLEELMTWKQLSKEIPEFFQSKIKTLKKDSALTLSTEVWKYTRSSQQNPNEDVTTLYWPLVKSVTIRVPENPLLQHVTLVDLPGTGDRNKSRDQMWKEIIGKCSTVWIVAELNRADSDKESWEILEDACRLMGNGGECHQIHFICTKSEDTDDEDENSVEETRRARILSNNMNAKTQVKKVFRSSKNTRKHFSDECFKVFTVSAKEFQRKKWLNPEDTEIPSLREILRKLNDDHSETFNYVSGAYGILALIEGARRGDVAPQKVDACKELEKNLRDQLDKVRKTMDETCEAFERCLAEGVEKSQCGTKLQKFLCRKDWRGFHKILKAAFENCGIYKSKKGREINLNVMITSHLTGSIDEEFRKTFPNGVTYGAFKGAIGNFSLNTDGLIEKYKDVELQLQFLKTEETQMKMKLDKIIRERKKKIYNSLTENIMTDMDECYKNAAQIKGAGAVEKMRNMILAKLEDSSMFEQAKDDMMEMMIELQEEVLETLKTEMQESIDASLKGDDVSFPSVSSELEDVKKYRDILGRQKQRKKECL